MERLTQMAMGWLVVLVSAGLALGQDIGGNQPAEFRSGATVDSLAEKALERAPTVSALRSRMKAANERIMAADAFPDPTLEIVAQEVGVYQFDPSSYFLLEYRQELPYPGKRHARQQSAKAESAMRAAEYEDLQRRVVQQVKAIYAQVYALDNEKLTLESARELLEMLSNSVSARYSAGQADQEAILKLKVEVSRITERLIDLESERAVWVAALNRLLDAPDDAALEGNLELPVVNHSEGSLVELALKNSSEIAVRQAYLIWTESKVREAQLDQKPDFMLGGGLGMDGMPQPMMMIRFGFQLPLWSKSKQEPLARSAIAENEAARQDLRDAQAFARAEAKRLQSQWLRDTRLIQQYMEFIIPQSKSALDAAQAAYLSNKGDFSTIIEDFTKWLEATTQLARREAGRFTTWASIEMLTVPIADRTRRGENHD